jgi:hypothetical protein
MYAQNSCVDGLYVETQKPRPQVKQQGLEVCPAIEAAQSGGRLPVKVREGAGREG